MWSWLFIVVLEPGCVLSANLCSRSHGVAVETRYGGITYVILELHSSNEATLWF